MNGPLRPLRRKPSRPVPGPLGSAHWIARWARTCLWVLLALGLTGCRKFQVIVPDMARTHRKVQLEGSNGRMLSASQSKAILNKLKAGGQEANLFDLHLEIEQQLTGTPITTGNSVALLQDGPATYQAMEIAIRGAHDHINMETYILADDEVGQKFAGMLMDKQKEGVQVNLIHDAIGTLGTPASFFEKLSKTGVKVLEFNPVNPLTAKFGWDVNQRDHRKILIVDGATAFLGGINISAVYSGGSFRKRVSNPHKAEDRPWRDTDLQVGGPVVADLQKAFMDTWERQKGEALPPRAYFPKVGHQGKELVRAIASGPYEPFSLMYATLLSQINGAESEILLTNAYFAPDPQLMKALLAAAKRGVKVRIVLPSVTDSWLVFHAGRSHYGRLLRGGVKLYERRDVMLHSKTVLIDGVWSTVGSTNLDWRSFLHNQEVNVAILGAEFGAKMRASFEEDVAASREITREEWRRRPFSLKVREQFARLLEYWL